MSAPSLIKFVNKRPWLRNFLAPVGEWYRQAAGYRQLGLLQDDLIQEESEVVQLALRRLTPRESYDRVFRIRRATQCSLMHKELPKTEWTKPEEDVPYLTPLIVQIEAEIKEKEQLDTMEVFKKH